MCRSKKQDVVQPLPARPPTPRTPSSNPPPTPRPLTTGGSASRSNGLSLDSAHSRRSATSTSSSGTIRAALPERPVLYSFAELSHATANFLAPRIGDSSSAWICDLRGKRVVVTRRPAASPSTVADFPSLLADLCSVHHAGVIKLLGGCADGSHVFLVHYFQTGSNLSDLLRPGHNPSYSPLATWIDRVRVAVDVSKALEYVHHDVPIHYVHKRLSSTTIIITDPDLRARIAHFGSTILTGEVPLCVESESPSRGEIVEEKPGRVSSRRSSPKRISGIQGYMAPEYVASGSLTQKSDVYSFGIVLLEILTGSEPVSFKLDPETRSIEKVALVEQVRSNIVSETGALRTWIDSRLRDSYPVDLAVKVTEIASACVDPDPNKRPDMRWVSGQLSRVWIKSKKWSESMQVANGLTVSLQGR